MRPDENRPVSQSPYAPQPQDDAPKKTLGDIIAFFFSEFSVVIIFGSLFVAMMALPLVFSGFLGLEAFVIIGVFLGTLVLTFLLPDLTVPLIIAFTLYVFIAQPEMYWNAAGPILGTVLMAILITYAFWISSYLRKIKIRKQLGFSSVEQAKAIEASDAAEASATATAQEEVVLKTFKPVAFDKTIAAEGVTIIYGTESGNAEGLAEQAKGMLEGAGFKTQILDAAVVDVLHLKAFANLLVITSTWGEGDPPSNAVELFAGLDNETSLSENKAMKDSKFSVCGLGDTNYEHFCECGKVFDRKLESYGATRVYPRQDCNVDFEGPSASWIKGVIDAFKQSGLGKLAPYDDAVDKAYIDIQNQASMPVPEEATAKPVASENQTVVPATVAAPESAASESKADDPVAEAAPVAPPAVDSPPEGVDSDTVVIIWGSESGNTESLASVAEGKLEGAGFDVAVLDMEHIKPAQLKHCKRLIVMTSTWGDGDPPSNAVDLVEGLQTAEGLDLSGTKFTVCGLGDTSYPEFCKCAKDFDTMLEKFGAQRIHPRVDCDLDYEQPFDAWLGGVLDALKKTPAGVA